MSENAKNQLTIVVVAGLCGGIVSAICFVLTFLVLDRLASDEREARVWREFIFEAEVSLTAVSQATLDIEHGIRRQISAADFEKSPDGYVLKQNSESNHSVSANYKSITLESSGQIEKFAEYYNMWMQRQNTSGEKH